MRYSVVFMMALAVGCSQSSGGSSGGSPTSPGTLWKKWTGATSAEELDLTGGAHDQVSTVKYTYSSGEACSCGMLTDPDDSGTFLNSSYGDFAISGCSYISGGADNTKCATFTPSGTYTVKTDGTMMLCLGPTTCFDFR